MTEKTEIIEVIAITHITEKGSKFNRNKIASFLFKHLDEFGDNVEAILKAINYALDDKPGQGGFIIVAHEADEIVGAVVVNETGMEEYIPENILVYIAVHNNYRGKGIGKILMQNAIANAKGSIALHVEPENPARHLYEKLGFTSKYLEMRLARQ
ncbi:MAG: GNAT family N-acetyltransferase [Bacteroidota bacterium]|nr:GNAT family N-acetyltransferase [Bacteroidota bacterium]